MGRILNWLMSESLGIEKVAADRKAKAPTLKGGDLTIPRDPAWRSGEPTLLDQADMAPRSPALIDWGKGSRGTRPYSFDTSYGGAQDSTLRSAEKTLPQRATMPPVSARGGPAVSGPSSGQAPQQVGSRPEANAKGAEWANEVPRDAAVANRQKAQTGDPAASKGQEGAAPFTVRRGQGYASLAKQLKMDMSTPAARQASLSDLRKMVASQNKGNSVLQPGMQFDATALGSPAYAGRTKLPGARPTPRPVAAAPQPAAQPAAPAAPVQPAAVQPAPVAAPQTFAQQNLAANRPGGPLNTPGMISPVRKGLSAGQQMLLNRPQVAPAMAPTSRPAATQMIPPTPMTPPTQPATQPAGAVKPPAPTTPAAPAGAPKVQAPKAAPTAVTTPPKLQTPAPATPRPKPAGSPL